MIKAQGALYILSDGVVLNEEKHNVIDKKREKNRNKILYNSKKQTRVVGGPGK